MADQVYDLGNARSSGDSDWMSFTVFEVGILLSGIAAVGAVVSAIMGLIGVSTLILGAAATVSAGVAMLTEGGAHAAGVVSRRRPSGPGIQAAGDGRREMEMVGGFGLQALTGLAAIVMGIFSIMGYNPSILLSVSALVMGAGLIATGISLVRRNAGGPKPSRTQGPRTGTLSLSQSNGALELIIGIAAGVFGILGLATGYPLTFALVAILAIGAAVFFNGTSMATKLFGVGD